MNTTSATKPGHRYECQTPRCRREYMRQRALANPEKVKAARRASYHKHKARISQQRKEQYAANPEPAKRRALEYRETHPELCQQRSKSYRESHRTELATKQGARYHGDRLTHLKRFAAYREKARPRLNARKREKSARLDDVYVREQLAKYSPLSMKDFPQSLVEAKRLHIKIKRITHRHERIAA